VHYNISFEVMSQRLINDNILVEQGCASIKKQTFVDFHSRNMVNFYFSKLLDFGMFGTMAKISKNFTISINHHISPIFHAENNLSKLQFNLAHFIGPILTLRGPTSL
jgi:hypothetical protein